MHGFRVTLTAAISGLQNGSKFVFGAVLGGMACFDFGGPVNKTMSTFVNGLMVDGVLEPEAVKFVGSMIPREYPKVCVNLQTDVR